jgi:hypothetical protein
MLNSTKTKKANVKSRFLSGKIKNLLLALAAMNFSIEITSAQIKFQKTFGGTGIDYANSIQQTSDSGYILAGYTTSFGAGLEDVYLIKTDYKGDTLWTRTYGGSGDDRGYSVQQTSDGGYIIAGYSFSFTASSFADVYLIKTNSGGDTLWSKTYGGANDDKVFFVRQTSDGGYILTGSTLSFGSMSGAGDLYLIKTDVDGDTLWTKTIGGTGGGYAGKAIEQTSDGGYIVTGSAYIGWYTDVYLVKTNSIGDTLWINRFDGAGGGTPYDEGNSVKQTFDGGYIVGGYKRNSGTSDDALLIKTDANGSIIWSKIYGSSSTENIYCVLQTSDSGYIFAGNQGSYDLYLVKTNALGDTLWTKLYGGGNQEYGYSIQQTNDGGYIIGGVTNSTGAGSWDVYIIKTDINGNSGCNQTSTVTSTADAAMQVVDFAPTVSSGCTVASAVTLTSIAATSTITLCTNVGIDEISFSNSLIVFPNPSTGNFIISSSSFIKDGVVQIFNFLGEKVFESPLSPKGGTTMEVSLDGLGAGIYLVKVNSREKQYVQKLLIEH